ncbi:uncharacterized protein LOC125382017 [Haliotis rufescens]|uniref:uncharacterized protein LOC125382017 n=1 Tax=Haliotis rufescens TaxID=6454 RepID=UPI00201F328F|nr:uncharacterized protein LOC125382017 [Haliotis rufescens]
MMIQIWFEPRHLNPRHRSSEGPARNFNYVSYTFIESFGHHYREDLLHSPRPQSPVSVVTMNVVVFRKPLVYILLGAAFLVLFGRYVRPGRLVIRATGLFSRSLGDYYAMDEHSLETPSDAVGPAELNLTNTNLRNLTQVSSLFAQHKHKTTVKPVLVLFTTWDSRAGNDTAKRNVLKNWSWLKPEVIPVLLTSDPDAKTEALLYGWHSYNVTERSCSPNSKPTLKSMFQTITHHYRNKIKLQAFATGDMLFDESIVSTFQAFIRDNRVTAKKSFAVLGKRTDVLLKRGVEMGSLLDVRQMSRQGHFAKDGLSGLFVTNHIFPWDRLPAVNGALPGVFEWIGVFCSHHYVPLYDITATTLSVHITTQPTAAQLNLMACNKDIIFKSGPHPPDNHCGHTECIATRSMSSTGGQILFQELSALPKSCDDCWR